MCSLLKQHRRRTAVVRAAVVLGPLCLLTACEVAAPEAHELFWKRVMFTDLRVGHTYETLTVFARVSDPDGLQDLDALFVINDTAQLFWRLTPQDWVVDQANDGTWIGSTALAMPENESLPSGIYRAVVQDIAGQTAELRFQIAGSTSPTARRQAAATDVMIEEDELTVTGPFASYEVWLYSSSGSRVAAAAFTQRINLESTLSKNTLTDELLVYVYATPVDRPTGYLSGPYSWQRN